MDVSRKSTYGYVLVLSGGPVSWGSTLGKTVATSTCEAEISAAVIACREAVHFKGVLVEFGVMSADSPLQIAEDNSAAIAQAQVHGLRHVRNAKHYEVRLAFLQQLVLMGKLYFCTVQHTYNWRTCLQNAWMNKSLSLCEMHYFVRALLFRSLNSLLSAVV